MTNPTQFTWTDTTTNADGTPIVAGEVTGYTVGVRPATGTAGTYPITGSVTSPTATSELFTSLNTMLTPGSYAAAIRADGPVTSPWSAEITFTVAPEQPAAPSGFGVA
jgi:hypothetical protein